MIKRALALALALAAALLTVGCNETAHESSSTSSSTSTSATVITPAPAATTLPGATGGGPVHKLASGLQYTDLVVGSGKMAEAGMNVSVHYSGWLTDGTPFDSSLKRGQPLKFQLGAGVVIQGWEEGIKGMRIGGKRKLTIPPDMGYGAQGYGGGVIPPNATLVFDIELLDVQ